MSCIHFDQMTVPAMRGSALLVVVYGMSGLNVNGGVACEWLRTAYMHCS